MMPRKSRPGAQYPQNWKEIATAVKDAVGWCCIRCGAPHVNEPGHTLKLGPVPFFPVVLDVAAPTKAGEVGEGVRLTVTIDPEVSEGDAVRDGQFFGEIVPVLAASLTTMPIPIARFVPLRTPVGTVVANAATLPMRAAVGAEMVREPRESAGVGAKPLARLATRHGALDTATLAAVGDGFRRRHTATRAVTTARHVRRFAVIALPAVGTMQCSHAGIVPYGDGPMPRKSLPGAKYPPNWKEIATRVKEDAGWCCVRCGAPHENRPGHTLTVHHVDLNPSNSRWWNLLPLCCPCHLQIQHKLVLERPWVMFPHSEWFKPYVAAWYALRYLGEELTREQTMARLDELLALEVAHVIQGAA